MDEFYQAIIAYGKQDFKAALKYCEQAHLQDPDHPVFAASLVFLKNLNKQNVYASGEAFGAFIRGGGNTRLYQKTSQALIDSYANQPPFHLLDIGVGDGMALLPALHANIRQLTLIEPSKNLLDKTVDQLNIQHTAFCGTVQEFALRHPDFKADIAQATFSLQSIFKNERLAVLKWLQQAVRQLVIVEFDVPEFSSMHALERVEHVVHRYQLGLNEYQNQPEVIQGFLMPVFWGYFDPTQARTNDEQSIQAWLDDLKATGFTQIEKKKLDAYWWADAYLIISKT